MFTFGFSYTGLIYLLMLFTPNIFWAKHRPAGYSAEGENRVLLIFERTGEVLCTCCVMIFSDLNPRASAWAAWLGLSFFMMILYELYWIRYFRSPKTQEDFYRPFCGIRVPGASLPVIAFLLLGIYGSNIFLILASVILGIGHIGIHLQHYRALHPAKPRPGVRIAKGIVYTILCLLLAVIAFFIGARNIHYFRHYRLIQKGTDEGIYTDLGGQEQYLLIRGADTDNPVIIFLHGGPSSPESYINYSWTDDLLDDYTVVDWDQRGCGRTYERSRKADPDNDTADYAQALADLDELVDYVCDRFGRDRVILAGHSYGTVLAADYIALHPEKVSSYIAIAQVVSMDIDNRTLAAEAAAAAEDAGADTAALDAALDAYTADPGVLTTMALRQEASALLEEPLPESSVWMALTSPYMGMPDFRWYLRQLGPLDEYLALNRQLCDHLQEFDLYDTAIPADLPVTFISGSLDYPCPVSAIEDYIARSGINGTLYTVENCGHNVQYTKPHEVSAIIREAPEG